jgi:hypothetical protein
VSGTSGKDFRDLVGDDVKGEEAERLRRVHDLLVQAGPPPELSPALLEPPAPNVYRLRPRRRLEAVLVVAAALAAIAFGAGYLVADHGRGSSFAARRVIVMHGVAAGRQAFMSLQVGAKDSAGNWPLLVVAQGLPKLRQGDYYELYLSWHGRPVAFCGYFAVHGGRTSVRMNAPFPRKRFDGWIVLKNGQKPGSVPQLST